MKMRKRGLVCQACSDPFGWPEYINYMMAPYSTTVDCYRCQAENYVRPRKTWFYRMVKLITYLISGAILLTPFLQFHHVIDTTNHMSLKLSMPLMGLFFVASLGLSIVIHFTIMKTFNWLNGSLTLDRVYKSALDYDHY